MRSIFQIREILDASLALDVKKRLFELRSGATFATVCFQ